MKKHGREMRLEMSLYKLGMKKKRETNCHKNEYSTNWKKHRKKLALWISKKQERQI